MSEMPLLPPEVIGSVCLAGETQFAPNGIVSRTVFRTPQVRQVLFGFDTGQELTEHTSPHHALIQVLSGTSEWTLGTQARTVGAGELLHLPPHAPHAVRATERFSMLLTLVRVDAPGST